MPSDSVSPALGELVEAEDLGGGVTSWSAHSNGEEGDLNVQKGITQRKPSMTRSWSLPLGMRDADVVTWVSMDIDVPQGKHDALWSMGHCEVARVSDGNEHHVLSSLGPGLDELHVLSRKAAVRQLKEDSAFQGIDWKSHLGGGLAQETWTRR